jgi:pyruvate dehydrogenase E1 component alpha subunit
MMVTIRRFEEEIAAVYGEQEMRSPTHLYTGQEATAAGVCAALDAADKVLGYYRGHGYYLAKGGDPKTMMAELYCKATGSNRGKGGSMLLSSPSVGYVGSTALVSGGIPIATGLALGASIKGSREVAVAFFGDAAAEEGVFYESLNFASLRKLPILFVCENNLYAVQSHISSRQAVPNNIYARAQMFDIPAVKIEGEDVETIYLHASEAVERARRGEGPSFIEVLTYRWMEHVGPGDDTEHDWRPKDELNFWKSKDPIAFQEKRLRMLDLLNEESKRKMWGETNEIVRGAFDFAKKSPLPGPEELMTSVY